jgi:propanol-preferring alcohol dehydrogenase
MATMTALRLERWGAPPRFAEVPVPRPGPGQLRLRMLAVGLCHTDLHFLHATDGGAFPYELPFTLGHENVGRVDEVGDGVDDMPSGTTVAVAGVHSCGRCTTCLRGADNYCAQGWRGRGYGDDGGLAEFLVVPRREVVPLGDLDPCAAAPLTDAGATSYHVVKKVRPKLVPGSTAVVIGAGGLGGYAIQHLRLLTPARVVAVDVDPDRLDRARSLGASEVLASGRGVAGAVRSSTAGEGAEAVLDFVGTDETARTALRCARAMGSVAVVGAGGGTAPVGWGRVPLECEVFVPMGATIADLHEVVALARSGALRMDVDVFPFERAPEAYERFAAGELRERAVVAVGT